MKRLLFILTVILLYVQQGHAQQKRQSWIEDFDGTSSPAGWTVSSSSVSGTWQPNRIYYQPNPLSANPQSYRGNVPSNPGDSVVLVSPVYDCKDYQYVSLKFSHICKVSPSDIVRVEYCIDKGSSMGPWVALPWDAYFGAATNYSITGFNAGSYPEWQAGDSMVFPSQYWWKEESFDMSQYVSRANVQFRFFIKHGSVIGSNASYGWLLDNFQLEASLYEISLPVVKFTGSYPENTVYSTGPYEINAKVKTTTDAPIKHPWLKYTATEPGKQVVTDSILMTHVAGDSLWKATIPKYIAGTKIEYSITGKDTNENKVTISSEYVIKYNRGEIGGTVDYAYTGSVQKVMLLPGVYEIEVWGADGGEGSNNDPATLGTTKGGKGGYSKGNYTVNTLTDLYIYVGGKGKSTTGTQYANGGWNGGGRGASSSPTNIAYYKGGGGGATDVRTSQNTTYADRIIVAGGGGGAGGAGGTSSTAFGGNGGYGGGISGQDGILAPSQTTNNGKGGTQTAGGTGGIYSSVSGLQGSFGVGGDAYGTTNNWPGGGGGGGWYGGGGGSLQAGSGGGGSGYIGGVTNGVTAQVSETGFAVNPIADGNGYMRITVVSLFDGSPDYAAATYSIDMPDTVMVSPSIQFPVIATIRNTGVLNMDSVIVSYSVNKAAPVSKSIYFNPALPWDYSRQVTLGYYTQRGNAFDTVVVWVGMPNGQMDPETYDDTLTKIIYGRKDIVAEFVNPPADTVYATGPYGIKARISTLSGIPINQVSLNVAYTYKNIITNDTLPMILDTSDKLWKTSIPQKRAGTDVAYSINFVNNILSSDSYYIEFECKAVGSGNVCPDYSAATHSIDIADKVMASPTTSLPITATIRNAGILDLDSVIVSYSLNKAAPVSRSVYFNPALPWNFTYQLTLGYYTPKINGFDTLVVWTSLPNGEIDIIGKDDTLTKVIYGSRDMFAEFIDLPADTVLNTGPFEIKAKISTLSGTPPNPVLLHIACTYQGSTANEDLPMVWDASDSLWKVNIPHKRFGSFVEYSLGLTDIIGNNILLSGSYYIEKFNCAIAGSKPDTVYNYSYTGSVQPVLLAPGKYQMECWGGDGGRYVPTSALGGKGGYSSGMIELTQPTTLYICVGDGHPSTATASKNAAYNGGNAGGSYGGGGGGATHIATATGLLSSLAVNRAAVMIVAGGGGGGGINNTVPGGSGGGISGATGEIGTFTTITPAGGGTQLNGGTGGTGSSNGNTGIFGQGGAKPSNNGGGGGGGGYYGGGSGASASTTTSGGGGGGAGYIGRLINGITVQISESGFMANPVTNGKGYVRITPLIDDCLDHSVALESINSPNSIRATEVSTPVRVTVRNRGEADLNSCLISWSLNGTVRDSDILYQKTGGLPEDFTDTITIGSYTPTLGKRDTITVWVKMPDGVVDSASYDDTLSVTPLGCTAVLAGELLIATGETFENLNDVFASIRACGLDDDLTLQLKGNYNGFDLSNISDYTNGHILTITSYDNHPDSATVKTSSGAGIILKNSNNIVIKAITVDVSTATIPAIQFTGACTNVVIRDCNLLGNTTSTTSSTTNAPIVKAGSTGKVDSIFIIKNLLNGGSYGFYFYGGISPTEYGTHVVFDSNTVNNQSHFGISACSTAFKSCSYNTILSRESNISDTWYGMQITYCSGTITGNKIKQRSTLITQPVGLYLQFYNHLAGGNGLIANNEILLHTTSSTATFSGINIQANTRADILHNSILIQGTHGRGIYVLNVNTIYLSIKNNNIVVEPAVAAAYPIHLIGISNLGQCVFDYNNMYAPVNVGYAGAACKDIQAWQKAVASDKNSVSVNPVFADINAGLSLAHDLGLTCPVIASVPEDISGITRSSTTTLGAYAAPRMTGNGMLAAITGLTDGIDTGKTENVKVLVYNTGVMPLTGINLGWSINGATQGNANYPVYLRMGDSTRINVGTIKYPSNDVNIKVWINNLNNNTLADEKQEDDTVNLFVNVCVGAYRGLLTIGQGGTFPDLQSTFKRLNLCGVGGDLTLAFLPGTYEHNIGLSDTSSLFGNHRLTITSSTGNASDVTLCPPSGAGIILNKINNVTIEALTIDVRANGTHGVQILGACNNITVNHCKILGTLTNSSYHLITKGTATDVVNNLCITNNVLDGGYYGIHLAGRSTNHIGNVRIDSNRIQNQYYYGVFADTSVGFTSLSCNTILSRETGTLYASWQGLRLLTSRGPVTGNTIKQLNTATITTPYGIYLNNHNHTGTEADPVAGNEIMVYTTGAYAGLCLEKSNHVNLLHNSIYVGGTGAGRGISLPDVAVDMEIKNNNIVMKDSSSYPVYLNGTTNLSRWDIDYNNMYAPVYAGYAGKKDSTIASWQQTVTSDHNSVRILPVFADTAKLELSVYNDTLQCPRQGILTDIRGYIHPPVTTMGAYAKPPTGLDLMALQSHLTEQKAVTNQTVSVNMDVFNFGSVPVNNATFGWSVNGQVQPTTAPYTFTPPLGTYQQRNVPVGTFRASGNIGEIEVVVWIETINTIPDSVHWNDTASTAYMMVPLAEFAEPLTGNTTGTLSFDVYTTIFEATGATLTAPQLYIEASMHGGGSCIVHDYDTIDMVKENGKWVAHIPKQYYNSNVIYQLHVSDSVGNTIVLKDSTYITFGSGQTEVYAINHNLAILNLISPVNPEGEMCIAPYRPVEIELSNLGRNNYDFTSDGVTIGYEIIDPKHIVYRSNITINIGELSSGGSQIVRLMSALPEYAGTYSIKAWVTSALDHFNCDDTLMRMYTSGKVGLPVDEHFSNAALPSQFISMPVIGEDMWKHCPDTNSRVRTAFGTGMLHYGGTYGAMAVLSTRQLDLYGAVNPKLEFWYFHDTAASALDESYTDVNMVADRDTAIVLSLLRKGNSHGWKRYTVDLSPYTGKQCVFIQFKSMNKFGVQSIQYIDRIFITSDPDVEVSGIVVTPNITVCGLTNKELRVVLRTATNQSVNLSQYAAKLAVEVPGYPTFEHPLQNVMPGNSTDTILIASNINLMQGISSIRAYLTVPIDYNQLNDTVTLPLNIRPAISVTAQSVSGGTTNCLIKGRPVQQQAKVKNTGNIVIPEVKLILNVMASSQQTLTKSTGSLNPGDSTDIIFDAYTVPSDADYQVQIIGYMTCDSAWVNNSTSISECVDINDLIVTRFFKPQEAEIDTMGKSKEIAVYLKNLSDTKDYTDVVITALIEVNGNETASYKEIVSRIGLLDSTLYTFAAGYTVPNETEYDIRVFINSRDNYPVNDTLLLKREAIDGGVGIRIDESGIFTLKQNIPNPADNSTVIKYSIPESGEVTFTISSINGQILYNKSVKSESGTQTIDINVSHLAVGIYFYSMEFNGQKITKRMSIKR